MAGSDEVQGAALPLTVRASVLVVSALVACGTTAREQNNPEKGSRDAASEDVRAQTEDRLTSESGDLPYDVCLQELGAPGGGTWSGRAGEARMLLRLPGGDRPGEVGYVALLRVGEQPLVCRVLGLHVDPDSGKAFFQTYPLREGTRSTLVVVARICGNALRFTSVIRDEQGIFPSEVALQLEAGAVGGAEARLRSHLEEIARSW